MTRARADQNRWARFFYRRHALGMLVFAAGLSCGSLFVTVAMRLWVMCVPPVLLLICSMVLIDRVWSEILE